MEGKIYVLRAVLENGKVKDYVTDEEHLERLIKASACQEEMPHVKLHLFEGTFCLNGYVITKNYIKDIDR